MLSVSNSTLRLFLTYFWGFNQFLNLKLVKVIPFFPMCENRESVSVSSVSASDNCNTIFHFFSRCVLFEDIYF